MSYFKLDVTNIKNSIEKYRENKKQYEEDLMILYNSLANVDSAWNDVNTPVFIRNVSSDRIKLLDYLHSLDTVFDELTLFIDKLESSISKVGYKENIKKIKFDDTQHSYLKKYFSNIIYYLNDAIYQINNYFIGSDFSNMNLIYNLRGQLSNSISLARNIIDDIDDFVQSVLDEVNTSINKINKIDGLKLDLDIINYEGNIVDL